MKKNDSFAGILAILLVLGMMVIGCDNGTTNNNGSGNPFVGIWKCGDKTIEFKADLTWTRTQDNEPYKDSYGTYAPSGSSAVLTFVSGDPLIGAVYDGQIITISGNSFTIKLGGLTDIFTKVN
jgi:hypothetical protein